MCNTTIKDCKFIGNQAIDSGGIILYERRGCLVTIKSSINQSVAFNSGGVVHAHGFSKVMVLIKNIDYSSNTSSGVVAKLHVTAINFDVTSVGS